MLWWSPVAVPVPRPAGVGAQGQAWGTAGAQAVPAAEPLGCAPQGQGGKLTRGTQTKEAREALPVRPQRGFIDAGGCREKKQRPEGCRSLNWGGTTQQARPTRGVWNARGEVQRTAAKGIQRGEDTESLGQ